MGTRVKALVLPIFRRHWLWHAWGDQAAQGVGQSVATTTRSWRQGATLEEKFSLLGQRISGEVGGARAREVLGGRCVFSSAAAVAPTFALLQPLTLPTQLPAQIQDRLIAEWNKLERAKEGSLRNRGYRCA